MASVLTERIVAFVGVIVCITAVYLALVGTYWLIQYLIP